MPYDPEAAERIREELAGRPKINEIKMFGGLCFTVNGNMFLGLLNDELMVRFPADETDAVLALPHVREMDFTKRPMRGYAFVAAEGYRTARGLKSWIDRTTAYVGSLPPKKAKKPRPVKKATPKRH